MDRRAFIGVIAGGLLAAPFAADAQQAGKVHRVGWLTTGRHPFIEAFRQGLRDHGYVEGQNLVIEERYADEVPEKLVGLAAELVGLKMDVILTSGRSPLAAAQKVSTSVPVVFVTGDPVEEGVVASLSRPGGNLTGFAVLNPKLAGKWVELPKTALPGILIVGILSVPGSEDFQRAAESAAQSLRLALRLLEVRGADEIERAFEAAGRERVGAIVIISAPLFTPERQRIVDLAARHRLPAVYGLRDYVMAGGLMSYGPDLREVFRRAASYVDKILKGAKPADLPVEQPRKFELVINLKAAKALGLTIPQSLLLRADQVIE